MKIGVFDSGLGGLTILKAIVELLPQYDYEFYGDTANLPYGDKTEEQIYNLTKIGVESLFEKDCQIIIIACNTASAETLRRLQDTYLVENYPDRRILGVIIPTIESLIEAKVAKTFLIGTERTVSSGKYQKELDKFSRKPILYKEATPLLVPLIEDGQLELALTAVFASVDEALVNSIDSIILGCTHYTVLKEGIKNRYQEKIKVFSQDEIVPAKLADYLTNHPEHRSKLTTNGTRNIKLTKHQPAYDSVIETLLGGKLLAD